MKLATLLKNGKPILAIEGTKGYVDTEKTGIRLTLDDVVAGGIPEEFLSLAKDPQAPIVENPVPGMLLTRPGKILCIGLNYAAHAAGTGEDLTAVPTVFSKFWDSLAAAEEEIPLPTCEISYDYEAELVVIIGKRTYRVSEEEAGQYIFGYTCGNDLSCRAVQKRTTQWLLGKTFPGFAPVGPAIVTADSFDPARPHHILSRVNGELRQEGLTTEMLTGVRRIIAYISQYIPLNPGDMIFTGTPSGVAFESAPGEQNWLKPGDICEVEIEGIGILRNKFIGDEI